jgi:hypothetical protein
MTIGSNVQQILNILRGSSISSFNSKLDSLNSKLDAFKADVDLKLDDLEVALGELKILLGVPETGCFNPDPKDHTMSVLQMTVGDPPHTSKLTFSEPGAPADGAVASDDPAVATVSLDPTDHVTWTSSAVGPGIANITYTGTSDPPDAGPVVVEPLVLTVVAAPAAETGQFNP